jgi:RNA polymerase subunit RPABC4/transcription elongation factor Spt4
MSSTPEPPAGPVREYEVVIHDDPHRIWAARARVVGRELAHGSAVAGRAAGRGGALAGRAAGRGGRIGLERLRAYLRSPEGRATATRTVKGVAVAVAMVSAVVLVRGWLERLAQSAGAFGTGLRVAARAFRAAAGAVGAAARAARLGVPLRWLGGLMRWFARTGSGSRRRVACPDCHARVRADAHVCYRCGYRAAADAAGLGTAARRRGALSRSARFTWRVLALRIYRSCPDCRRRVHADARVCSHCGFRLRSAPRGKVAQTATAPPRTPA